VPAAPEADDLFDLVARHNLHFGQTRQTGVVFRGKKIAKKKSWHFLRA
jgi:hypothetical protein